MVAPSPLKQMFPIGHPHPPLKNEPLSIEKRSPFQEMIIWKKHSDISKTAINICISLIKKYLETLGQFVVYVLLAERGSLTYQ